MKILKVFLGEIPVGNLIQHRNEFEEFRFEQSYLGIRPADRPLLGQLFEDRLPTPIQVDGPIGWFAHLLPQAAMRRWQCNELGIDQSDSFELLQVLGHDLPGAVHLEASAMTTEHSSFPMNARSTAAELANQNVRFSLPGNQWKLSARSSQRGLTTAANVDGIPVIAKFHAPGYPDLPRNEAATMKWASKIGLQVPVCKLRQCDEFDELPKAMPTGDGTVFTIERFDRLANSRVHMEDFAQIFDRPVGDAIYHGDFENIAAVVCRLTPGCVQAFLKQVVFTVCCGNGDSHLKNFSLQYHHPRKAMLSPVYDQVATVVYGDNKLALRLGGSKDWQVDLSRFHRLFERCNFSVDEGEALVAGWANQCVEEFFGVESDYSQRHAALIREHLSSIPLTRHCL